MRCWHDRSLPRIGTSNHMPVDFVVDQIEIYASPSNRPTSSANSVRRGMGNGYTKSVT